MRALWPELPVEALFATVTAATTVSAVWAELAWSPYPVRAAPVAFVLAVAAAAVLVVRRRWPVPAAVAALGCLALYHVAGYPGGGVALALFVALYSVPVYSRARWTFAACAGCIVLVVVILALPPHRRPWFSSALLGPAFGLAWMVVLGAVARARRLAAEAYVRRAELQMREGLAEERLRIARELHDVLAHTISVISVQAGVALDSLDTAPERARAALLRVRAVAAEARPELRAALGLLRAESATPEMLAQPGLAQLDDLVAKTRAAGLHTVVDLADDLPPLPAFTQLTLFRIIQEALTNAVRHAHATTVTVTLRAGPAGLHLTVRDDGRGPGGPGQSGTAGGGGRDGDAGPAGGVDLGGAVGGGGLGLAGMRERVHLLGGTLTAGPAAAGGGFLLDARIPLEDRIPLEER